MTVQIWAEVKWQTSENTTQSATCLYQCSLIVSATSLILAFQWIYSCWDTCRHLTVAKTLLCIYTHAHMHAPLPHRLRMEETLDQTGLINNSWEMVAQPSCLQPQNSHNHRDAKHTHHSSHPAYSLQTQWLRHAGTYFSPQRRHPPSAELLTQTGCLRASWVYTKLWRAAACVALQKEQRRLLSLCHRGFDLQGTGEWGSQCGTVSVCTVKAPFWMAVIQMSAIKTLLGIQQSGSAW